MTSFFEAPPEGLYDTLLKIAPRGTPHFFSLPPALQVQHLRDLGPESYFGPSPKGPGGWSYSKGSGPFDVRIQ